MAYGLKYELFFADAIERKMKLEIHQKDYVGSVSALVGSGRPVEIEWTGNDDIYSPFIGSRCKINLMVTDSTSYDDFYAADEREYLVKVLHFNAGGNELPWEALEAEWQLIDTTWDAEFGTEAYYDEIWEGFIVIDRYQEQMIHKPFPISLEAICGLGTLDGFDTPFDKENTSGTKDLFYYVKEILKLTGHNHNIYVANETREVNGDSNETIFHDIVVDEYALFTKNLTDRNAKDVLKEILEITNSRIFHSMGHWFIVNNSSLIDKNIDQQDLGPSGDDIGVEPVDEDPYEVTNLPNVSINGGAAVVNAVEGGSFQLFATSNSIGGAVTQWTWNYNNTNYTQYGQSIRIPATSANDGITVTVTGTNSAGSDSDTIVTDLIAYVPPADTTLQDGEIKITIENRGTDFTVEPLVLSRPYRADEIGDTVNFNNIQIIPTSGHKFDALTDITNIQSNDQSNVSISGKTLESSGIITFDVAVTIANGMQPSKIFVDGQAGQTLWSTTITLDNDITNTNVEGGQTQFTSTGLGGTSFEKEWYINANTGYYFDDISRISANYTTDTDASRTLTKVSNNQLKVRAFGVQPFNSNNITLQLTGNAIAQTGATAFASGMSILSSTTSTYHNTYATGMINFIRKNGRFLTQSESNTEDLFNGDYKINIIYTSGGSGWLTVLKVADNYTTSFLQVRDNQSNMVGVKIAKDKFNYVIGPNSQNSGIMNRVALIQFVSEPGGSVLHTLTYTQNGIYS